MLIVNMRNFIFRQLLTTNLNFPPLSLAFSLHTTLMCAHSYYPKLEQDKYLTIKCQRLMKLFKKDSIMFPHFPLIRLQSANKNHEMHQEKSLLLHVGRAVNDTTHECHLCPKRRHKVSYCRHLESKPSNQSQKQVSNSVQEKFAIKPHRKRSKSNPCLQLSKLVLNTSENILLFLLTRSQYVFRLTQLQILLWSHLPRRNKLDYLLLKTNLLRAPYNQHSQGFI